ncbi:MAG TPA: hypothetical protein PLU71_04215 [Candidatus Dependentiae bacterium]|nr:hypothetical protein [Candidatus Dependentiae bacterium]HRQ63037.1 hypothetical protein [Candidatus Dependentiae bacterium]
MKINTIFLAICLIFTQLHGMQSQKELALPTDFYPQLLQDFVQTLENSGFEKNEVTNFVQEIHKSGVMLFMGVGINQPHTDEEKKRARFIVNYEKLVKNLIYSSLRKSEGCFIQGEGLNPWETDWNLEMLSQEEYAERMGLKKHCYAQECQDYADVMFGNNAPIVRTQLFAMGNAEQEAHAIMLCLLQQ